MLGLGAITATVVHRDNLIGVCESKRDAFCFQFDSQPVVPLTIHIGCQLASIEAATHVGAFVSDRFSVRAWGYAKNLRQRSIRQGAQFRQGMNEQCAGCPA